MSKRKFDDEIPVVDVKLQAKLQWHVQPSDFSKLCQNPIRNIVDNIEKPASLAKSLISLSLGGSRAFVLLSLSKYLFV